LARATPWTSSASVTAEIAISTFSEGLTDRREQLLDRLPLPFCRDDHA
jgi:hypothetical protein